ncbi:disease resistance protein RGA2-like [Triticum aestivum]|uniref:disease resistance protein RGA2-like n=1 Tax=Triticum aestivum TaxID=4565 RepID=UPI001D0268C2|nr:disease resistance protein RGA2-like [Triticum aestivum]
MEVFEEFPNRSRVEQLFNDLENAFYEAEDILDDIEYHCLEKKMQDDKFKSDSSVPLRKRCWLKKLLPKAKGSQPKKIRFVVRGAFWLPGASACSRMNSNSRKCQAAPASSEGAVTTGTPPPIVFGRDKERDKNTEMLHEKEAADQPNTNSGLCYSVIGIHGIGGSGKSTLAHLVYAHEKDQQEKKGDYFDLVMMVHVSQNFSVGDIFKEIFEVATGNSCPQLNNLNTLQDKLEEKLHGKRFLLVLDDVLCDIRDERQHGYLRQIFSPLKAREVGSKILVTSRIEDALLVLGAKKLRCVPISDLDDDVFYKLLMHYALEGAILDDHVRRRLNVVGADIAKNLKGLPLSVAIQKLKQRYLRAFVLPYGLKVETLCLSYYKGSSWDSLPSNMENLMSIKKLTVDHCLNIRWLLDRIEEIS